MYGVSSLMPPCLQKAWHGDVTMFAGSMLGQYFTYGVLKKNEKDSWRENTACCLHRKRRNKQYLIIWEKTDHINSIHCFIEAIILDLMQERKFLSLQASFFQSWRTWEDLGFFFQDKWNPQTYAAINFSHKPNVVRPLHCAKRDYLSILTGVFMEEKLPQCWFYKSALAGENMWGEKEKPTFPGV